MVSATDGDAIAPKDFQDLEIVADLRFWRWVVLLPHVRLHRYLEDQLRFGGVFADGALHLVRQWGLLNPVTVRLRGFGMDLWSRDFAPDDAQLTHLERRAIRRHPRSRERIRDWIAQNRAEP